ncbi:MAG: NERD domain-containing protein [Micrococcales bacterium]|nr:NERD domain-containing protein [Micrococcales bacterium]
MVHGYEPGRPAARRARRLVRRRVADPARTTADGAGRPGPGDAAPTRTWFDDWLTGDEDAVVLDPPDGWTTLHDLRRPGSASRTLDCLAIGPGGVVVIQSLHWDGSATVVDGTLRLHGYGRTPDVAAAADAAGAVTSLLAPTHRRTVRAVVSLAGQDLPPATVRGGAVAVGEHRLAGWLAALPPVLAPADARLVRDYLAAELTGPASPELLTVDDVFRPREVWAAPDVPAQRPGQPDAGDGPVGGSDGELGGAPESVGGSDGEVGALGEPRDAGDLSDLGDLGDEAWPVGGSDATPGSTPGPFGGSDPTPGSSSGPVGGSDGDIGNRIDDSGSPEHGRGDTLRPAPARGAIGDGALRVGMLVLGLLTAGNILLAWLDAAG